MSQTTRVHPNDTAASTPPESVDFVEVEGKDLPIHCPNPRMPLWAAHPRVFLDIVHTGKAKCPYCGTEYRLRPGTVVRGH
jgi:uncharacterized Zn-finger protein